MGSTVEKIPRRGFLVGACIAVAAGASGCLDGGGDLAHYVDAYNDGAEIRNVHVRVATEDGETLFQELFRLESGVGDETRRPFDGAPATITVTVDGRRPRTFDWPVTECEGAESAGGAEVTVTADGSIDIAASCNTVRLSD